MNAAKQAIQRSLPHDTKYSLISTFYRSIEDGAGVCQNCGKIISNIAEIKNTEGQRYHVGMDCAATLQGIKGDFDFEYVHKARFSQAKQARASLLKQIKEGAKNIEFKTFTDTNNFFKQIGAGRWHLERTHKDGSFAGYNWKQYNAETWTNYVLPMIKELGTIEQHAK